MSDNSEKKLENKGSKKPNPTVLSINICDAVIRDETTKKITLVGLFNTVQTSSFPATHPLLHVYVALTNGHGKYNTEVRFLRVDDNTPIVAMAGELEFNNPLQVAELNLRWQNLPFERGGQYSVEVFCDGACIGSRKFRVVGPKQAIPPICETEVM